MIDNPRSPVENPARVRGPTFTDANVFSAEEKERLRQAMAQKGVRQLPYPFASAVAAVSDVDGSSRARYDGYVGMLVGELGLDFGDSTWLQWQSRSQPDGSIVGNSSGFFSRHFSLGHLEDAKIFETTRTLFENVAEFHSGNVDHFHAFLGQGPKVVLVEDFRPRDGRLEIELDPCQSEGTWQSGDFYLVGICAVGRPGKRIAIRAIDVNGIDGDTTSDFRETPFNASPNGREHRLFTHSAPATDEASLPRLDRLRNIVLSFYDPEESTHVARVFLINIYGDILLNRVALLRNGYNVETNLVTEHAGLHFRNHGRAKKSDEALAEHVKSRPRLTEAYNGSLTDDDGKLIFTTDADNPHSFCRVLPELSDRFEVRFIVPAAATQAVGWDPLDLVTPTLTRAGGTGFYWARRTLPPMRAPLPGQKAERIKSHGDNFAPRIARVLEGADEAPGAFWPIYTHLGGIGAFLRKLNEEKRRDRANRKLEKRRDRANRKLNEEKRSDRANDTDRDERDRGDKRVLPSPYFEPGPLRALQDRVFNMSGRVAPASRLWFARASVLYDYALMLRSIADQVERPDENSVRIASWFDPILDKTLPRSPAQLYGLTFYVNDAAKGSVDLDGQPIEALIRNPPDETGRPSVTIAAAEIRYVIFDALDPTANCPGEIGLEGGRWQWHPAGPEGAAFGRLSVDTQAKPDPGGPGLAALRIPLHGLAPVGAQGLTLGLRGDPDTCFGLLVETRTGGRFYYGDEALLRQQGEVTASYVFAIRQRTADGRQILVAPLHDLAWTAARPGGPMPNHSIEALTILCQGRRGSSIDIGSIAFSRPRATGLPRREAPLYCVAGRVPAFETGQTVHAAPAGATAGDRREMAVDQRGHFCFAELPPGIYRVWSRAGGRERHDRRGALVEVGTNVTGLVLERLAPE